jgi:hypothetical protein
MRKIPLNAVLNGRKLSPQCSNFDRRFVSPTEGSSTHKEVLKFHRNSGTWKASNACHLAKRNLERTSIGLAALDFHPVVRPTASLVRPSFLGIHAVGFSRWFPFGWLG